jgi:hypothetical protein
MKSAISIPDALFLQAERLARRKKLSRSALYAKALESYLASEAEDVLAAEVQAFYSKHPQPVDPFTQAAAVRRLMQVEWKEEQAPKPKARKRRSTLKKSTTGAR